MRKIMNRDNAKRDPRTSASEADRLYLSCWGDAGKMMTALEQYPGVVIAQDWDQGTTSYLFSDESRVVIEGPFVTVMHR